MSVPPGLQVERTVLAWQRTALTAAVAAILSLRGGLTGGSALELAAGVGLAGLAVFAGFARRPARASRGRLLVAVTLAVGSGLLVLAGIVGVGWHGRPV